MTTLERIKALSLIRRNPSIGFICAILANLIWGSSFLASKFTIQSWDPFAASAIRFSISTLVLFIILFFFTKGITLPKNKKHFLYLFLIGTSAFGILYPLQLTGMSQLSSAFSASIMLTSPLFVVLLSKIFLNETLGIQKWIALALGISGGFILINGSGPQGFPNQHNTAEGALLTLLSSLSLAISIVVTKKYSNLFTNTNLTFWSMLIGTTELLIFSSLKSDFNFIEIIRSSTLSSCIAVFYLGLICSAFCFFIWNFALSKASPQDIASSMHIKTPTAILFGLTLGGEQIHSSVIIGTILVIFGVWLSQTSDLIRNQNANIEKIIKYQLSRQIIHDLRGPIETLQSVSILNTNEFSHHEMNLFKNCLERLNQMANKVLHIEKADNSQMTIKPIDIKKLITSLLDEKNTLFLKEKIMIQFIDNIQLKKIYIPGNELDFYRAMSNLIKNSVESMKNSDGIIKINISQDDNKFILSVSDTGIGMTKTTISKMLKGGYTSKENGNGIGFGQIQETVETMGGELQVQSEENKGTIVSFVFPWEKVSLLDLEKIVLIDDDRLIRTNWQIHAIKSGISLECFESIDHFLSASHSISIDTIICIDSCLGNGEKGETASKKIADKGFRSIFLSTSYPDIDISSYPWIQAAIGKKPIFA